MRRSLKEVKFRLAVAKIVFLILFAAVLGRAFQLQVLRGPELLRLAEGQHLKKMTSPPKRGAVLDRAGESLAVSLVAHSVGVHPRRVRDKDNVARELARILHLNPADVRKNLGSEKSFVWIKRQVTPQQAEQIEQLGARGLEMSVEPNRFYPQGQIAGQVIGFVNRDSEGLEGLELHYNDYIRGESGSSLIEFDAKRRSVLVQGVEELRIPPGADLHLTLDSAIQHLAEKELEGAIAKHRAKAGVAIVVEPFTGELLALANYPTFNPNVFSKQGKERARNRAITDSFEPGSTFKTVLAAAALEEGVIGKDDVFYCEMGKYPFAGKIIHDTHPYGWLPFSKVLQVSSNICFTKVAEKLKKERYFRYIEKFGFGKVTGVDMPGEVPGILRHHDAWAAIDLATHAFGQGISATPLQMAMAYGAVANGGFLMRPYVAQRITGPKGEVLFTNQPHVVRRVISQKTARELATMLKEVTREGGTGTLASVEGFDVAGKTGTAQKADPVHGGYSKKRVASFVGFVPADEPRLVLMVMIDEPEASVYGGVVAAPAFGNIARGALRHLAVAPRNPDLVPLAKNSPEPLLHRVPSKAGASNEDGNHRVPDFLGLSLREAVEKARAVKVKVRMHGHGHVIKQQPLPGAVWNENQELILNLQG
ncbi:MAG TPA: penicillin-binding transpeptidase domain-containing protein [Candidatus Binatia bacterium]|nr:penicillin-binding transpeptidase domain-containing protein [Candidatus Binatia bacterium]